MLSVNKAYYHITCTSMTSSHKFQKLPLEALFRVACFQIKNWYPFETVQYVSCKPGHREPVQIRPRLLINIPVAPDVTWYFSSLQLSLVSFDPAPSMCKQFLLAEWSGLIFIRRGFNPEKKKSADWSEWRTGHCKNFCALSGIDA